MQDDDVDVREEIRVATFWRQLIGDRAYEGFMPSDLFRWYVALELAGPDDVRELYHRRQGGRPMKVLQGLVNVSPYPPATLVEAWLDTHETKVRTLPYWYAAAAFITIAFMFGIYMNGLQNLQPVDPMYLNPPQSNTVVMAAPMAMPQGPNTPMPSGPVAPVSQLPISPQLNISMPISMLPILPSTVGGTMRTMPLQEVPTDLPQPQAGVNGNP